MEIVIVWLAFAIIVAYYNSRKGNGWVGSLLVSLLLSPLIGLVVALVQRPNVSAMEHEAMASGDLKKCPQCAEMVKTGALVCRFCQYKFSSIALGVLVLVLCFGAVGCIGDLESGCSVGGLRASSCTFTNKGSFPGRKCVNVMLTKKQMPEQNMFRAEVGAPIGTVAKSGAVCSGIVWGSSTTTVEIPFFTPDPMEMCAGWKNCDMDIVASND